MMGGMIYSTATYQANLENEDRYLVKDIPVADSQIKVYAVFDGHGGHDCSSFLEQELSRELEKAARRASKHKDLDKRELKKVLMTSFREVDEQFLEKRELKPTSGSCALCACFYRNWVFFANVGDSRAVLGTFEESPSQQQNGAIRARVMTQDQDATNQKERKAVSRRTTDSNPIRPSSSSGPLRVAGSLMVTRAIGDAYLKLKDRSFTPYNRHVPYITSAPIITTHCINPGKDRFVVIATDGLFNWMSNDDVVECVFRYLDEGGDPSGAAHHLIEWTLCQRVCPAMGFTIEYLRKLPRGERRLVHDDITVVVITLPTSLETSDLLDETLSLASPGKYSDLIESDSEFDAEDDFGIGLRTSSISSTSTELADTTVRLNFTDIHINAEDLLASLDEDVDQSPHYDNHEETLNELIMDAPSMEDVVLSQIEGEAIMEAIRDIHEVSRPGDVFTVDVHTELVHESDPPPQSHDGSNRKSPKKRKKAKWTKRKRSSSNNGTQNKTQNNFDNVNVEIQKVRTNGRNKKQKRIEENSNFQSIPKKRSTRKKKNKTKKN